MSRWEAWRQRRADAAWKAHREWRYRDNDKCGRCGIYRWQHGSSVVDSCTRFKDDA